MASQTNSGLQTHFVSIALNSAARLFWFEVSIFLSLLFSLALSVCAVDFDGLTLSHIVDK